MKYGDRFGYGEVQNPSTYVHREFDGFNISPYSRLVYYFTTNPLIEVMHDLQFI